MLTICVVIAVAVFRLLNSVVNYVDLVVNDTVNSIELEII